jgi:guanine deaminase
MHSEEQKTFFIDYAIRLSLTDIEKSFARPFGAIVVHQDKIIAEGFNTAVRINDPTAHAEVNAIRSACAKFASYILPSGCSLFSSSEPCPLCFSAAYWAGISEIYFALDSTTSSEFGFSDSRLSALLGTTQTRGEKILSADFSLAMSAFHRFLESHPAWLDSPTSREAIRNQL